MSARKPLNVEIDRQTLATLQREAEERHTVAHDLAAQLLETIARDALTGAVLDDAPQNRTRGRKRHA